MKEVSVSFLSKINYKEIIEKLNKTNCDYIHFDVMDGIFVPNKNLTCHELKKYLKLSSKKNDIHLMVEKPLKYLKAIKKYNVSYVTIHYEIKDYLKYIDIIKDFGFKVGISIKPDTKVESIFPILDKIDLVLIMSVEPGASGQSFIKETKDKLLALRKEITKRGLNTKISVDGGINDKTLKFVDNSDILVSASYVIKDFANINVLKGEVK